MGPRRSNDVRRARRGLLLFGALTIVGSAAIDIRLARDPSLMLALMWVPGLASLITRAVLREGFADISLRFERRALPMLAVAWLYPIVALAIAYGFAWGTGLEPLRSETSAGDVAWSLARSATLGIFPSTVSAAGEELGWRGYLLKRLIDARVPYSVAVSGLVWWAWHLPLVLTGVLVSGPSPVVTALLFLPSVMAIAFVAALVRCDTGSIWPAVMLHASFNAVMDLTFDPLTAPPPGGQLWTGASGILVAIVCIAGAVMLWSRRHSLSTLESNWCNRPRSVTTRAPQTPSQ